MKEQQELALALERDKPAVVDLSQFRKGDHISPVDEVNIVGWINYDYNYNLVKRKNNRVTGERFMYLLFGQGDTVDSKVVRAALVFNKTEKEMFSSNLETFYSARTQDGANSLFNFNGFASDHDGYGSMVKDAIREQNLHMSPDFVYIKPFFHGREAALAPHGVPEKARLNVWLFAIGIALFGVVKYFFGRMGKKPNLNPARTAAQTYARPMAPQANSVTADSPLGRLNAKASEFELTGEVSEPFASGTVNPSVMAASGKPEKKFPVKLALLAVIVVATAIKPNAVFSILPLLLVFGFWVMMFGGKRKIEKLFADLTQKSAASTKKTPPKTSSVVPVIDRFQDGVRQVSAPVKASMKPSKNDSFADGPIRSASSGLFGRLRKKDTFDPFEKLAQERKSF